MSIHRITASECDRIRREREAGKTFSQLTAAHPAARSTVSYHVSGKCSHDVPPLDTDAAPDTATPSDCERAVREALATHDKLTRKALLATTGYSSRRLRTVLHDLIDAGVVETHPKFTDPRQDWYYLADEASAVIPE